jgi:methylmalonyl-CoA mutase
MEVEQLLDEFPPVSTQAWEDVIRQDLKGADCAKKLVWQTPEGIAVKPYYRSEDIAGLNIDQAPGNFPYLRGARTTGDWRIREEIEGADPEQTNRDAQKALAAGAEEISFLHVVVRNTSDLGMVLANLQDAPLHFENADDILIGLLCERLKEKPEARHISTGLNPLANPDFAASIVRDLPPALFPFTIHGEHLEEAGANTIQEVAYTLAAGIDYLAEMMARGIEADRATAAVNFSFSVGGSYFFQIAKFRAFRMLWAQAVENFGGTRDAAKACLQVRTSLWNKTIYDPYVNVLRATTEAMAAIIGGADSVCVAAFDECYRKPSEESRRLARNTQIMLKHEALLAQVADPGAGSYYLETITDSLAREAWKTMQQIEANGGYRKWRAAGKLDHALQESYRTRENSIATRRRVLTGTNQYANAAEKAMDRIDESRLVADKRGATAYEQLRLRTERYSAQSGKTPRVLLAEFGDVKMRGARSTFAANFFACAGFEISIQSFDDADKIAAAEADLIVLCSADAEYPEMAADVIPKLESVGRNTPVLIAGNPEQAEQLRAEGVADFIHIRSNPIEVLTNWQQRLGMKVQ